MNVTQCSSRLFRSTLLLLLGCVFCLAASGCSTAKTTSSSIPVQVESSGSLGASASAGGAEKAQAAQPATRASSQAPVKAAHTPYVWTLKASHKASELLLVEVLSGSEAEASMYLKLGEGKWKTLFQGVPAYIGKNGLGKTRSADKKTPTGIFAPTRVFGLHANPGSRMPYTQAGKNDYWVGDNASKHYNELATYSKKNPFDTKVSERISQRPRPYQYVVALNYNEKKTPGLGAGIFLQCFGDTPFTNGSVAIPEATMIQILKNLTANGRVIIDTRANMKKY